MTSLRLVSRAVISGTLAAAALTALASLALRRALTARKARTAGDPRPSLERYPRNPIPQAAADRSRGLADTDCRVLDESSLDYCPRPEQRK